MYNYSQSLNSTGSVTNLLIDSCEVYDTNRILASNEQCSLIRVNGFEIKNSKFHDSGINGINTNGKDGVDFKEGTSNGSIHHCEMYGSNYVFGDTDSGTSWNGVYLDGQGSAEDNIDIYNNYFHDISCGAVTLGNEAGSQGITNIDIYNNIFYNNQSALRIYPYNFTRNYRFINNTCYKNYETIESDATSGTNSNCIIRNNILYGTFVYDPLIDIANYASTGKPTIDHNIYYNTAGYQSVLAAITGGYTPQDPLFVSTPGNLKVQSTSPAIDAGSSSGAPATDYTGTGRPQGTAVDIGAYEMTGTGTGTVSTTRIIGLSGTLSYGSVAVGSSASRTLTITNSGNSALTVNSISYPTGFSGAWSGSIAAGGSQSVSVTFTPTAATTYSGTVTVNSDMTGGTNTISCSGTGTTTSSGTGTSTTRIIGLSGTLSYGSVAVGSSASRTLTITNSGNSALTVNSISYPTGFSGAWSGSIAAGGSQSVSVTFTPTAASTYSGTVTVNSDMTGGTNTISCSGTGTTTSSSTGTSSASSVITNPSFENGC